MSAEKSPLLAKPTGEMGHPALAVRALFEKPMGDGS